MTTQIRSRSREGRAPAVTADPDESERFRHLRSYVPRLVIDWLHRSPRAVHQRLEGTLVFADISGFTSLTERLARLGKVGAEEIEEVVNRSFTHLLNTAYDYDGNVLKWGGDAVLLLFTGPEHTARAARSAYLMRQVLKQIGHPQTSGGRVRLRMSVGIHSGEIDLFLVGGSHRELIVAGPSTSETVRMESTAEAGEILLSQAAWGHLGEALVGRPRGRGRLLRRLPDATGVLAPPVPEISGPDLSACLPLAVREHLLSGAGEPEHRRVAVSFVEFRGFDRLLSTQGAAAAARALDELVRSIQDITARYDVTFLATDCGEDGGKVLLAAGAPRATGNEEEQLLLATREIVGRPGELSRRAGVTVGHVFAADFGSPHRRTYSVVGDVVNLGARLMSKTEPGHVLATSAVLERSRTSFHTRPLEPFQVKGKRHPVRAFEVGPPEGTKKQPRESTPLVGRKAEMSRLRSALRSTRAGTGRLIQIVGEPGIGKSRLLDELVAIAGSTPCVRSSCDPYESSTPYHAFRGLLRGLVGIPDDAGPEEGGKLLSQRVEHVASHLLPWVPLLAVPLDVDAAPTDKVDALRLEFRKRRLEEATSELLGVLLPRPTVLVFEDVHWMDDASCDLLTRLASDLGTRPWLIAVSRRDQEVGFKAAVASAIQTLRLEPLDAAEAARLITATTRNAPLPPSAAAGVIERSGGNPFFLRELVSMSRAGTGVDALPEDVESVIAAEIDALSAPDRTLLRYASVLGTTFDPQLLSAVVAEERGTVVDHGVWSRVSGLVSSVTPGTYRFRHALLRDVAYEGLPYRRRRRVHGRVADTIERAAGATAEHHAEILSLHFFEAGRHEKAWRYARTSGDRARAKFANAEATTFYRRAIASGRTLRPLPTSEMAAVFASLGDVLDRAGSYADAATAYQSARRLAVGDRSAEARLLLREGIVRDRMGRYTEAMRWYRRGLRTLDETNDGAAGAIRAQLQVWYAAAKRQQGKLGDATRWCLLAVAQAKTSGELDALAHAYRLLDWIHTDIGRPEAASYRERALKLYEELGDLAGQADMLNQLGIDAYFEGRWDEAIDYYERARTAAARTGDAVTAAHGTNNIAEILSDQGDLDAAEELFEEALMVWRGAGFGLGVPFATSNLGRIAARRGQPDEAQRRYEAALSEFRRLRAENQVLETEARVAENHLLAGRASHALASATATLARADDLGGQAALRAMLHRIVGEARLRAGGDPETARVSLEQSLAIAEAASARYETARTLQARAELARTTGDPAAARLFAEARTILERLGVRIATTASSGADTSHAFAGAD